MLFVSKFIVSLLKYLEYFASSNLLSISLFFIFPMIANSFSFVPYLAHKRFMDLFPFSDNFFLYSLEYVLFILSFFFLPPIFPPEICPQLFSCLSIMIRLFNADGMI